MRWNGIENRELEFEKIFSSNILLWKTLYKMRVQKMHVQKWQFYYTKPYSKFHKHPDFLLEHIFQIRDHGFRCHFNT